MMRFTDPPGAKNRAGKLDARGRTQHIKLFPGATNGTGSDPR